MRVFNQIKKRVMKIVYDLNKSGSWTLYAYAMPSTPVDMCKILDNTHKHTEYDTKYGLWLDSMNEKEIINHIVIETLKGSESVIVKFTIIGNWKSNEDVALAINEFDKYMDVYDGYESEYKYVMTMKKLNEFRFI